MFKIYLKGSVDIMRGSNEVISLTKFASTISREEILKLGLAATLQ